MNMEIQDIVKDYKLPVEESAWEAIAQDKQLLRFNRRKLLQRVCLYGVAPVVVTAAVVTAVLLTTSSKKAKDAPVQPISTQEVVVQQTVPDAQENQKVVAMVGNEAPVPVLTDKPSNHSSQPAVDEFAPIVVQPAAQPALPSASVAVKTENRTPAAPATPAPVSKPSKSAPASSTKNQDNNEHSQEEPETPVSNYQLFIPNAFTPNGDGINDLFKVEADFSPLSFEIAIYSRKGDLVFLNKDMKLGWDGTFRGKELPAEVYNYLVKYTDPDGKQSIRRGQVTLIR